MRSQKTTKRRQWQSPVQHNRRCLYRTCANDNNKIVEERIQVCGVSVENFSFLSILFHKLRGLLNNGCHCHDFESSTTRERKNGFDEIKHLDKLWQTTDNQQYCWADAKSISTLDWYFPISIVNESKSRSEFAWQKNSDDTVFELFAPTWSVVVCSDAVEPVTINNHCYHLLERQLCGVAKFGINSCAKWKLPDWLRSMS